MAISDEVLLEFMREVRETSKVVVQSATKIDSLEQRFDKVIEKIYVHSEAQYKEVDSKVDAHAMTLASIAEQRRSDKRIVHVVGSFLALEGAVIGWLLKYYLGIVSAAKALLTHTTGH